MSRTHSGIETSGGVSGNRADWYPDGAVTTHLAGNDDDMGKVYTYFNHKTKTRVECAVTWLPGSPSGFVSAIVC